MSSPWKLRFALQVVFLILVTDVLAQMTPYHFKRYAYKKKQRQERKLKTLRLSCEESDVCREEIGFGRLSCMRKCMSAECYKELYGHDELEEGEIDVRTNSFKGCVLQQHGP